jgi:large subunit ribosomal protein L9
MEVILREDIEHLGQAGEIVGVKAGYARNFLIPRGLAYWATAENKQRVESERRRREERHAAERAGAEEKAQRLASLSLTFTARTGEGEKLFGSITAADIAEQLTAQGHPVDKRHVELEEPIRMVGIYKVPVRLGRGVVAEVRVWVVKE